MKDHSWHQSIVLVIESVSSCERIPNGVAEPVDDYVGTRALRVRTCARSPAPAAMSMTWCGRGCYVDTTLLARMSKRRHLSVRACRTNRCGPTPMERLSFLINATACRDRVASTQSSLRRLSAEIGRRCTFQCRRSAAFARASKRALWRHGVGLQMPWQRRRSLVTRVRRDWAASRLRGGTRRGDPCGLRTRPACGRPAGRGGPPTSLQACRATARAVG